jgi:hypothetical protein
MRDWSAFHRLRKYQRKKEHAVGQRIKWERLAKLYWRYWHKVNGGHSPLWQGGDV